MSSHLIEYQGRIRRIKHDNANWRPMALNLNELDATDPSGTRLHHPEEFCYRCGNENVCWYTPHEVWNPVMRPDGEFGPWHEIICMPCFIELAERKSGPCAWRLTRDQHSGIERLDLLQ